jgi:hypothetical protein
MSLNRDDSGIDQEVPLQEEATAESQEEHPAVPSHRYRPPHIVHYENSARGPMLHGNNPSSDQAYGSTVSKDADDNIFYPFSSKLEWEFAKWAKLQGSNITASAVTDLLSIDGVCPTQRFHVYVLCMLLMLSHLS